MSKLIKKGSNLNSKKKVTKVKPRKKSKGLPYIQRVLHKYYPKRYPTYASAKERATQIKFLMSGEKYTVKNVLSYERKPRKKKLPDPTLSPELTSPNHYFNLTDYPTLIAGSDNRINFRSKLFTDKLVGGETPDYNVYFKDFTNHCDSLRRAFEVKSQYVEDWYIKCSEPYYNRTTKQWESLIFACDVDGSEEDYGFQVGSPESKLPTVTEVISKTDKEVPKTEETPLEAKKTVEEEIRLNESKAKVLAEENRKSYMDLFKQGVIDASELKKLLGL